MSGLALLAVPLGGPSAVLGLAWFSVLGLGFVLAALLALVGTLSQREGRDCALRTRTALLCWGLDPWSPLGARPGRLSLLLLAAGLGLGLPVARADQDSAAPLSLIAPARVRALAPLLRSHDLTLIESHPSGSLKQLTILTLVAARPETVREVVWQAERYPEFLHNLSRSQVSRSDDGSFVHSFQVAYGVLGLAGRNRFVERLPVPAAAADDGEARGEARPIELFDPEPGPQGNRHLRFEFYAAGGGTVFSLYAYASLPSTIDLVRRFVALSPQLEPGFALAAALTFALSVKSRAEQLTAAPGVVLPAAGPADYDFLLARGPVALLRSRRGRLSDISLIARSPASREALLDAVRQSSRWSESIPIVAKSSELAGSDEQSLVELQLTAPLFSLQSRYAIHTLGYSVDMLGVAGELVDSRLRWDIQPLGASGAALSAAGSDDSAAPASKLILRGQHSLERASLILRQLYRREPLMEYGVNLGLYLLLLNGVRSSAERSGGTGS